MQASLQGADSILTLLREVIHTIAVVAPFGFVHGDLKAVNILMRVASTPASGRPSVIITDFGSSGIVDSVTKTRPAGSATTLFAAPEALPSADPSDPGYILFGIVSTGSDVFSLGVMLISAVGNDIRQATCLRFPGLSNTVYAMIRPTPGDRLPSADMESSMDRANVRLPGVARLPGKPIGEVMTLQNNTSAPWNAEMQRWQAMTSFVELRLTLLLGIDKPDFVADLDAGAAISTFHSVGWGLADLKAYLFGVAYMALRVPTAYAGIVGLDEKLNDAFAHMGPAN